MGGHGDTMVPLPRFTKVSGKPLLDLVQEGKLSAERLEEINQRTRDGGAEIVKHLEKNHDVLKLDLLLGDDLSDENFVKKSYLDILGRDVDSNSLTSLASQLKEKIISHDDLLDILKKSDEFRASFPPLNRNWLSSIDWTKSQWNEKLTECEFFQEKNLELGEIYYSLIINELESKFGDVFQRKNFLDINLIPFKEIIILD